VGFGFVFDCHFTVKKPNLCHHANAIFPNQPDWDGFRRFLERKTLLAVLTTNKSGKLRIKKPMRHSSDILNDCKIITLLLLFLAGCLGVLLYGSFQSAPATEPTTLSLERTQPPNLAKKQQTLRSAAEQQNFHVGAAVSSKAFRQDSKYREVLAREFNMMTPENAMKWRSLRPSQNEFNFDLSDSMVSFAEKHNMKVRGHTLVWHRSVPQWLQEGDFDRSDMISLLREHIQTVVNRYQGKIYAWDVVNEAITRRGELRDTIWLRTIGPEYIEMAFRWAHAADPDALLFYNDYGGEETGVKADGIYQLVKELKAKGVPIDGVGMQMHKGLRNPPDPDEVRDNMERLADLGMQVHITEMDVRIQNGRGSPAERFRAQGYIYQDMLETCMDAGNCDSFVMWGFTDAYSWIPQFTGNPDAPLIFDEEYEPKPAYRRLMETLRSGV
jgi:endo-1,4-beta-xylanase